MFTDSGGIQEEYDTLKIPCVTFRSNTERPEILWAAINILVYSLDKNFSIRISKAFQ